MTPAAAVFDIVGMMCRRHVPMVAGWCLIAGTAMSSAGAALGACSSFDDATPASAMDGSTTNVPDAPSSGDSASDAGPDAPVTSSAYRSAVLADNPIVYWRMGSAVRTVPDETGHGNDLLVQGASGSFELGAKGALVGDDDTAIRFDGRDGRGIATDAAPFDFPQKAPFTIELWAMREELEGGSPFQKILDHEVGSQQNRTGFSLQVVVDPVEGGVQATGFEYNAYDGGDTRALGPLRPVGTWAHYAATFDGTKITVYVNGVAGSSVPLNGVPTPAMADLIVGGPASNPFPGTIDEVAIYDHVLGAARIVAHITAAGR